MAIGQPTTVVPLMKRTRTITIKYRCGHKRTTGSQWDKPCPEEKKEIDKLALGLCPDCEMHRQQRIIREKAKAAADEGQSFDPSVERERFVQEIRRDE